MLSNTGDSLNHGHVSMLVAVLEVYNIMSVVKDKMCNMRLSAPRGLL